MSLYVNLGISTGNCGIKNHSIDYDFRSKGVRLRVFSCPVLSGVGEFVDFLLVRSALNVRDLIGVVNQVEVVSDITVSSANFSV